MIRDYLRKKSVIVSIVSVLALFVFLMVVTSSFKPINPNKDKLNLDPRGGKDYSLIYKYKDFYQLTNSDRVLKNLQYDLNLYGRNFYSYFGDRGNTDVLSGFTFEKGVKKVNDKTFEFTGKFYGVKDEVKITATKIPNNLVRVSITDNKGSNIDEQLRLNGPMSRLVEKLPIDESLYSIRYLPEEARVIVTFYANYQITDVDEVAATLNQIIGNNAGNISIDYSVNARGKYTLEDIRNSQATLSQKP